MTSDPDDQATSGRRDAEVLPEWTESEDGIAVSMKTSLTVTAIVLVLIAAGYLWQAFSYSIGTLEQPGPGLFPVIIGALFVVAGIGLLIETRRNSAVAFVIWPRPAYAVRLALVLLASILYIVLLPIAGQAIAGFVLCVLLLTALHLEKWWLIVVLSVVFSASLQYLFSTVLGVPLPRGPFTF